MLSAINAKEVACANCLHKGVCKYEDDLRKAQEAVNGVKVSRGGEIDEVHIRDLPWVMPVVLGCRHRRYDSNGGIENVCIK